MDSPSPPYIYILVLEAWQLKVAILVPGWRAFPQIHVPITPTSLKMMHILKDCICNLDTGQSLDQSKKEVQIGKVCWACKGLREIVAEISGLPRSAAPLWAGMVTGCDIRIRDVVIPFRGRHWGKRHVVDTQADYGFEPIWSLSCSIA